MDICQSSLYASEFFEISRRLHLLDGMNLLRIQMNSFGCNNKIKKFTTGYPQEGLGWTHLQLVSPHDVEHSLQVCEVIAFVAAFHDDVIDVSFYGLIYMLVKDRIHGALICHTNIFQAEGHYCVAIYTYRPPKDVCLSSLWYIFI